ncbi:MAG TPA: hypothetical protein VLA34_09995, partial [Candidatus Krumholzibacterium sp.]|nr:hypothetical protein [Candidatus Krumholzibacterium sp.]
MMAGPAHLDFLHVGSADPPVYVADQLSRPIQGPTVFLRVIEEQVRQRIPERIPEPVGKNHPVGIRDPHFDRRADVQRRSGNPVYDVPHRFGEIRYLRQSQERQIVVRKKPGLPENQEDTAKAFGAEGIIILMTSRDRSEKRKGIPGMRNRREEVH